MRNLKPLIRKLLLAFTGILIPSFAFCQEKEAAATGTVFASEIGTAKKLMDLLIEFCVKYSFQVLGGIVILALGWFAAKVVAKIIGRFLAQHKVDVTVAKFLISIIKLIIIAFAALIALGKFGVTIAPFIAGLSVIGFGTSFALQGPLSNYAAGATLIFTKPFKVGDIIETANVMGEVEDMTLARTQVKTVDGTTIIIPNKHIVGEVIHNYSGFKKLDMVVGVSYDSDVDKAIGVVKDIVAKDKRISKKPEPKIGISEFADSSINIYARLWCKQSDYWSVKFDINKKIHDEFKKNNIAIPFPQRDVHIYEEKA